MSSLWTDERVEETVTSAYVHSQLRPNEQDLLQRTLYFGGDLTDDTYLDWILTRARRFFLILVATGVPDQIFGVVDDSYDDEDLPIIEQAIPDLRLSYKPDRALDKRFYKNQFRYLTRIVGEGEHIRYADEETVPINTLSIKSVVLSDKEGTDKVQLPSEKPKVFVRQRIALKPPVTEDEILNEIAASRRLCHEHVTSVFGSYLHQGMFNVLSVPAAEWTLKSFLTDTPKAFSSLSKTERRQTLINWPHCLANALSWLHRNGEYHGAIRPSNIHIDDSFRVFLGLLEGDGFLRDKVKSDDIEAYQYAPPERWKRAVTVQSSGSGDVSLPSGGRSVRRVSRTDKSDGKSSVRSRSTESSTRYTFQPTSRGNYARLRLSTAIGSDAPPPPTTPSTSRGRSMRSRADTKSISTQGTSRSAFDPGVPAVPPLPPSAVPATQPAPPPRAPSVMSSSSSNGTRAASAYSFPLFVAAPEGRSAVVQTWQSVEWDMFASDMFSLGAVTIDILNLLVKRSYGSFARHRSSKNRMAGRGGGLADASFHANLGQVYSWAQSLQGEAAKKAPKDPSQVYHSVGPVISVALQCLDREPKSRMTSEQLEKKLDEYIHRFAGISRLHCVAERVKEREKKEKKEAKETNTIKEERTTMPIREMNSSNRAALNEATSPDRPLQLSTQPARVATPSRQPQPHQPQYPPAPQGILSDSDIIQSPTSHASISRSGTTMSGTYSVSSHPSTSFDGQSDTVVAESPRSREQSVRQSSRRRDPGVLHEEIPWAPPEAGNTLYWHKNDSEVDPRLSFGGSVDNGAFTYLNYSASASSEEGVKYFPRPPSSDPPPPQKAPPTRELPPLPPLPTKIRSTKPKRRVRAATPTETDVAKLSQLSSAATGGHPLRMDSLPMPTTLEQSEDYHQAIRLHRRPHTARELSTSPPGNH